MLTSFQRKWGVEQWVVFLKDKEMPVLPRTKVLFAAVAEERPESVSPRELAGYVFSDPFLALKLLRRAEERRSRTLGHDTTTALGSVLQTGFDGLLRTIGDSPTVFHAAQGLNDCEFRSVLAASIGRQWAAARADISAEEVALAALLAESGELLLWHFAPELPQAVIDELKAGRALRTLQAQQQTVGFSFKQLTLALADAWQLPPLISFLIKGADTPRANIARLATDTARHIVTHPENPAIPADIVYVKELLPGVPYRQLVAALPITDEYKETVLQHIAQNEVSLEPK